MPPVTHVCRGPRAGTHEQFKQGEVISLILVRLNQRFMCCRSSRIQSLITRLHADENSGEVNKTFKEIYSKNPVGTSQQVLQLSPKKSQEAILN